MVFDPVLELKLGLLHELLTVESARDVLSSAQYSEILTEVYEEKPLREYVEALVSIGDGLSKPYIDLLTKIRIFLLGS
jgi:hypothetical protein